MTDRTMTVPTVSPTAGPDGPGPPDRVLPLPRGAVLRVLGVPGLALGRLDC